MRAALVLLMVLSVAAPGPVASAGPLQILDVSVSGDELAVDVHDAPLAQVLAMIGQCAGVTVTLYGDLSTPVTESFAGLPLEEGIRRLTRGHGLIVTYDSAAGEAASRGLSRIWVTAKSSSTPSEPGPSLARDQRDQEIPRSGSLGAVPALVDEAGRDGGTALTLLTDLSTSGRDPIVREQAVAALGRLGGAALEPALIAALADDDSSVRVRAIRGLRGIGTDTAMQSLAGVLTGDGDPRVRLAALRALTSFPTRAALDGLAKAASDTDELVREAANRGLSWWTTRIPGAP